MLLLPGRSRCVCLGAALEQVLCPDLEGGEERVWMADELESCAFARLGDMRLVRWGRGPSETLGRLTIRRFDHEWLHVWSHGKPAENHHATASLPS